MIKLTNEKILLLHKIMIESTGGSGEVRDFALLDSAVNGIYATFDGSYLYPSKEEKAAKLGFSLISNHAFVDGNKRIGIYAMMTFLEINGIPIDCTNEELTKLGLGIADGRYNHKHILDWINKHKKCTNF